MLFRLLSKTGEKTNRTRESFKELKAVYFIKAVFNFFFQGSINSKSAPPPGIYIGLLISKLWQMPHGGPAYSYKCPTVGLLKECK